MAEDLISFSHVAFAYPGGQRVFEDLSFRFGPEERLGLVGSNGSGKTTFLTLIMGLIKAQAGQIKLFGQICQTEKDFRVQRLKIGFVFQDANDQLFCPTVGDDIAFGPLNMGRSKAEVKTIVEETLALLGLSEFYHRPTYGLSDGEKKLVSIGTALAMKPSMLILDEPTTCLDEEASARVAQILLACRLPYLIVSHDHSFLDQVTNERVFLKKGPGVVNLNEQKI